MPALAPRLGLAPVELCARAFDVELARRDLRSTLAQLPLQLVELGELHRTQVLALFGEMSRQPEHLVALHLGSGAEVPVVALPGVFVRLHLQGI